MYQQYLTFKQILKMLWMIVSFVVLIMLVLTYLGKLSFLQGQKKPLIMASLVTLLLLLCIIDEITIPDPYHEHLQNNRLNANYRSYQIEHNQVPTINISSDLYWNFPPRAIIKQERVLLDYLGEIHKNSDNIILYIKEIDIARFRAVFKQFQKHSDKEKHKNAIFIDFALYNYQIRDLQDSLNEHKQQITYIIPQNIQSISHLNMLEMLYHNYNISIIILNPPLLLFPFSSIYKFTSIFSFTNNWVSQALQNHPPKIIELCSKYKTIDYKFYLLSQSEPLSELCSKSLVNQLTQCIKQNLPQQSSIQTGVPYSKVKHCWKKGSGYAQGVLIENGIVKLKKDYFYSQKISEDIFLEQQHMNQNL